MPYALEPHPLSTMHENMQCIYTTRIMAFDNQGSQIWNFFLLLEFLGGLSGVSDGLWSLNYIFVESIEILKLEPWGVAIVVGC